LTLAFLATAAAALNLLEYLSGKVIALPTLDFSKLLLRTLRELSCSHRPSTLASLKR